MESLNYHHLRLFHEVAREGNLTRASRKLGLSPQTVSSQVKDLEEGLGESLFERVGRTLVLTTMGSIVRGYADEIFATGDELLEAVRGQTITRPMRLLIGVANVLPKLIVHRLIEPALKVQSAVQVVCHEGTTEQLLVELSAHRIDVVLSDGPIRAKSTDKVYNHSLGKCGITFMAPRKIAQRLRPSFPQSLDGQAVLLPTKDAVLRRSLDLWFEKHGVQPKVAGEFEDSALLKAFGQAGVGFFAIPSVIAEEVSRQYSVEPMGKADGLSEYFYAISVERRLRHPGIVAISKAAKSDLFA